MLRDDYTAEVEAAAAEKLTFGLVHIALGTVLPAHGPVETAAAVPGTHRAAGDMWDLGKDNSSRPPRQATKSGQMPQERVRRIIQQQGEQDEANWTQRRVVKR